MPFLSVIVPLFNEEEVINEMQVRLTSVLDANNIDFEIIMVNDGSQDRTHMLAKEICKKDKRIKLLSFSRNFGHQTAITAGMDKASGETIVVIDADLQDPPEVIIDMIEKWKEGFKVVYGVRKKREGESLYKLATANLFYRLLKRLTAVEIPVDVGDFRLMDKSALAEFKKMREQNRFVRGMVSWIGFKQGKVEYVREARFAGETKYPFKKMLHFALNGIFSFSQIPLKISSALGLICSGVSFIFIIYGLMSKFFYPETTIHGWTSVFTAILFLGGVQLLTIGILGEYLGRIYDEIKGRPLYIIEEEINFNT